MSRCGGTGQHSGRGSRWCRDCHPELCDDGHWMRRPGIAHKINGKRFGRGTVVYCPTHPYANKDGRVRRSHVVWEFTHHQFLPKCFLIHHINGIHDDDRPENLVPMFPSEHMRWHRWEGV